ncbi:DUF7146 domain-containing protein [Sphingomonas panni]|uniref:DUF7146 domain-containing protein n=1 Tax=Sphingomonas panni TaxID=237612 RepID=UPI001F5BA1CC|nr:hypothetical protein [Sphingomonas panni]
MYDVSTPILTDTYDRDAPACEGSADHVLRVCGHGANATHPDRLTAEFVWDVSEPILGTPAERFILNRGLGQSRFHNVRFHRQPYSGPDQMDVSSAGTLVVRLEDETGHTAAVRLLPLDGSGRIEGASRSIGPTFGCAARLSGPSETAMIVVELDQALALSLLHPEACVLMIAEASDVEALALPAGTKMAILCSIGGNEDHLAKSAAIAGWPRGLTIDTRRPRRGAECFVTEWLIGLS